MIANQRKTLASRFIEWGARAMVWVAGGSLLIVSFVIAGEALGRKFAGYSIGALSEVSGYIFAISSSWAFGWALLQGAHIRITALRNLFAPRIRAVLDVFSWGVFLIVFAAIAFRSGELAYESYLSNARSPTPARMLLYIPQALWAFGFAAAVCIAVHLGFRAIRERSTESLKPMDEVAAELEHLK